MLRMAGTRGGSNMEREASDRDTKRAGEKRSETMAAGSDEEVGFRVRKPFVVALFLSLSNVLLFLPRALQRRVSGRFVV